MTHLSNSFRKLPISVCLILLGLLIGCTSPVANDMEAPVINPIPNPEVDTMLILQEDFETEQNSGLYGMLNRHSKLTVVDGVGVNNSQGLQASYVGYSRGSERIVLEYPLGQRGTAYTLCYDVRFDDDFQFVRGGKLMGFGPDEKVTGGHDVPPDGWSVRSNFTGSGGIHTYVYSQNKRGQWGESEYSNDPVFRKGEFHRVSLQVLVNDPAESANGASQIYVDGELQVVHTGIQFRKESGNNTLISTLLFETFHGGNTSSYAPKDANGNFTTVTSYFDNIEVYQGFHVCEPGG